MLPSYYPGGMIFINWFSFSI